MTENFEIRNSNGIEADLKVLSGFFRMPHDKAKLLTVLKNLRPVLWLATPVAETGSRDFLIEVITACDRLLAAAEQLGEIYPLAVRSAKSNGRYYDGNGSPHYCIYWHLPLSTATCQSFRGLLASMLPVITRLEKEAIQDPVLYAPRIYETCHALRSMTEASGAEFKLMCALPTHALAPEDLFKTLDAQFDELSLNRNITGPHSHAAKLMRALCWHLNGNWARHSIWKGRHRPHATSHRNGHGAEGDWGNEIRVDIKNDDGFTFSRYVSMPEEGAEPEELGEPDAAIDGPSEMLIDVVSVKTNSRYFENRRSLARRNACRIAQAIRNSNQRLMVGKSMLSGYEIACFLNALDDRDNAAWEGVQRERRLRTAIWAACRFWLGRSEEWISKAHVSREDDGKTEVIYNPLRRSFYLAVHAPSRLITKDQDFFVDSARGFWLKPASQLLRLLDAQDIHERKLFHGSFELAFTTLLHNLNRIHGINLTSQRLERIMSSLISQLAEDHVIGDYFRGSPPEQNVPCIYTSLIGSSFQSIHDRAFQIVCRWARFSGAISNEEEIELPLEQSSQLRVGARAVPKIDSIRSAIGQLFRSIEEASNAPSLNVVSAHNFYTTWVAMMLYASTGVRSLRAVLPWTSDVVESANLSFVSEKDSADYRNARLVHMHSMLCEQLIEYDKHVMRLRRHLVLMPGNVLSGIDARDTPLKFSSSRAPDRTDDLKKLQSLAARLFLISEGRLEYLPLRGLDMESYIGPRWHRKVALLRHFVRSRLTENRVGGEYINALLGHGDAGTEPWGRFSTLSPSAWQSRMNDQMADVLSDLGFRVVRSPLFGGRECPKIR